jgi:hypothetical protein
MSLKRQTGAMNNSFGRSADFKVTFLICYLILGDAESNNAVCCCHFASRRIRFQDAPRASNKLRMRLPLNVVFMLIKGGKING